MSHHETSIRSKSRKTTARFQSRKTWLWDVRECGGHGAPCLHPGFWVDRQTSQFLENCPESPLICQWGQDNVTLPIREEKRTKH